MDNSKIDIFEYLLIEDCHACTPYRQSDRFPLSHGRQRYRHHTQNRQASGEISGVDETQAIHQALHELAIKVLPQYEAHDGPLTATQIRQIKKRVPQDSKRSVRSSLFETKAA